VDRIGKLTGYCGWFEAVTKQSNALINPQERAVGVTAATLPSIWCRYSKDITAGDEGSAVALVALIAGNVLEDCAIKVATPKKGILDVLVITMTVIPVVVLPSTSSCEKPWGHHEDVDKICCYCTEDDRVVAVVDQSCVRFMCEPC
jgi:hypothetical protein